MDGSCRRNSNGRPTRTGPLLQASRHTDLNNGKATYPFILSRPSVSKQGTEKTETPSTKMQVDMVEKSASTFLGAGNLQAINCRTPDALSPGRTSPPRPSRWRPSRGRRAALPATPARLRCRRHAGGLDCAAAAAAGWAKQQQGQQQRHRPGPRHSTPVPLASNTRTVYITEGAVNLATQSGTLAGMQLFATPGLPAGSVVVGDFTALLTAETPGAPVELRAGAGCGTGWTTGRRDRGGGRPVATPPAGVLGAAASRSTSSKS